MMAGSIRKAALENIMSEPWSADYRDLSIVPVVSGNADEGYTAAYHVNRTQTDGTPLRLTQGVGQGRFATEDEARDAAMDAAQGAIDKLLAAG
jgi:hypothetical protein